MTEAAPDAPRHAHRRHRLPAPLRQHAGPRGQRSAATGRATPLRPAIDVAVVDDDALTRYGIRAIISQQVDMRVLDETQDMASALSRLASVQPDFVIVDARLAGENEGAAIRVMLRSVPTTKIIAFGHGTLEEEIFQVLEAGAVGYLLRNAVGATLVSAIRRIQAGGRYVPDEVLLRLQQRQRRPQLTRRERSVLELLCQARSNATIAAVLDISIGTVKLHVKSILAKLGVEDRAEAAVVAMERGFFRAQ
jgi:DNA-binding NarL/FixJ family response regulator